MASLASATRSSSAARCWADAETNRDTPCGPRRDAGAAARHPKRNGSSRITAERGPDLEEEVVAVAIAVGHALACHSRTLIDGFHQHLLVLPEVLACYHVAGADAFLIHVGVRDSDHLRDFTLHALTEREEVAHIETRLIFGFQRNVELPARADAPA